MLSLRCAGLGVRTAQRFGCAEIVRDELPVQLYIAQFCIVLLPAHVTNHEVNELGDCEAHGSAQPRNPQGARCPLLMSRPKNLSGHRLPGSTGPLSMGQSTP
jgi:hypothetical protein